MAHSPAMTQQWPSGILNSLASSLPSAFSTSLALYHEFAQFLHLVLRWDLDELRSVSHILQHIPRQHPRFRVGLCATLHREQSDDCTERSPIMFLHSCLDAARRRMEWTDSQINLTSKNGYLARLNLFECGGSDASSSTKT